MIAFILALLLSIAPLETESGWISAYDHTPTVATIKYRITEGQLPADLSPYDGVVAVLDCGMIGEEAILLTENGVLKVIVFDCAGAADGGAAWMVNNNIMAEVGWELRVTQPDIVHSKGVLIWRPRPANT